MPSITSSPRWERLLYFIFFLSGASGLVYEVIWVRLTGLVFGNTAHAIATVLGAFMAGLALGSWKLGQRADSVASPLKTYGLLEIGIGISAALVPVAFSSLDSFYWSIEPALASIPGAAGAVRFIASFAILLVPTFMMGGTLPMLSRFFTDRLDEVERKVGLLYALNTFGAALGTMLAALYFIPGLGNRQTTFIIAGLNFLIGFLSIWLSSRYPFGEDAEAGAPAARAPAFAPVPTTLQSESELVSANRLVLLALGVSGLVSMTYEVAWTRALAALMGSSTYAFSIMLVTFLTGIALGSAYISRRRPAVSLRLLGMMQLGVAFGGLVFLVGYVFVPYLLIALIRAFFYSFPAILTIQFLISACLMILPTLFMGATFPIASQLYSRKLTILGRSVGNVYSVNTVGAILGSLSSGFLLIPTIGTERTILVGLFLSSAVALLLLSEGSITRPPLLARGCALVLLLVATLSMRGGVFWKPEMMDRGVLIYSHQFESRPELTFSEHYEDTDLVYFKEGNNATISVRKGDDYLGLRTNGKVDASNRDDMMTQLSVAYLAGFYHPAPKDALIIGYGSGVTVGAATAIPEVQTIDCIEIEPAVVGAGPQFATINRQSYQNPKVNLIYNDARNFMNTTRKQYDIIISEPSNPWIAGVASLFTAEFYDRAVEVLKPDGVFIQWVQLYELHPDDLRMILREVQRKFPEVSVWNTGIGDLIVVGTQQPQRLDMGRVAKIVNGDPSIMRDFREYLKIGAPEAILSYYVISTSQVKALAENANRNTDDLPLLEFHAPRQLFEETGNLNVGVLYEKKDGLIPPGTEVPDPQKTYLAMVEPFLKMDRPGLANQAMAMLSQVPNVNPAAPQMAIARINLASGRLSAAEAALRKASEGLPTQGAIYAETEELWGLLFERTGSNADALLHFTNAANADPSRAMPTLRVAELHAAEEAWDEAAQWMQRYIALQPRDVGHYWAVLGDYRLAGEQPGPALEALQSSISLDPYTYWAHFRMARLFEDRKQMDDAIRQYEFIVRYAFDRDADVYLKLGRIYQSAGRLADARRVLAKGKRMFPTNPEIFRLYQDVSH